VDCAGICGGSATPNIECEDGNIVCYLDQCSSLDISTHILPKKFGINKIFPNPFNPVTQIQYEISEYALVKIRVFDIQGREVELLINENQTPGRYSYSWDASNKASGMYFVELSPDLTIISTKYIPLALLLASHE
jgi:hypothetical protein